MACAPSITAFIPEAQTLFTVVAITLSGKPANLEACRAGAWPRLACITLPIMTSSTNSGFNSILSSAPFIAVAPSLVLEILAKLPPKLPMGVLTAETI